QDTYSISAADINGDQTLDLFLSHWTSSFGHGGGFLWANDGAGSFTDITTQAGLDVLEFTATFTANFSDIDGDADLDLLVSSDFGTSKVLLNDGGVFSESTGSVLTDQNGMGSAVGDYDGDGDMDWFVSSILELNTTKSGNRLYQNDGSGTFTDVSQSAGVRSGYWGWGSCFADFDNDGWLDLFHVNGWPRDDLQQFVADPSRLFMSNGDGSFTEASLANGLMDDGQGRGVVCFDADRDGDIDIFVSNNGAAPRFYVNQLDQGNYLGVVLRGPYPNTQGIGALITITPSTGGTQVREIRAGSNYVSQNPAEAHFGLGDATSVDLSVRWPDGMTSNLSDVAANQLLVVSHPGL
ncbi:MAG: CRTAC1 family protein, partial [Gemmatimonadetes bacterium]|nr:CRTAC1 family protein [Gemmatimonadota bacterium]